MIGILGAYGTIGVWATRFIKKNSQENLRIGGRNIEKAPSELRSEWDDAEWMNVNVSDRVSVEAFMEGCSCILDCAKLNESQSHLMDEIGEIRKIPVVHLGIVGYKRRNANVPILYGAGSIPGLSGLIPQYFAQEFDSVNALDFYYGGVGAFSYTAAKDYLDGILETTNHSMVCWKNGEIVPFSASENDVSMELGRFVSDYKSFPYFDEEADAITRKLHLSESRFQMCVNGKRTIDSMNSARFLYKQDPQKTIENLCLASKLDSFGISENTFFLCIMDGKKENRSVKKELLIYGLAPARATGTTAAAAVLCIAERNKTGFVQLLGESDYAEPIIKLLKENEPQMVLMTKNLNVSEVEGEI